MNRKSLLALFAFVLLPLVGGFLSGQAVRPNLAWYGGLTKPWFNPPAAAFAPVWSLLYILMGLAAWRVWRKPGAAKALGLWFAQLLLNFSWTAIFFVAHRPGLALIDLVGLWLVLNATAFAFGRIDRPAAWLMVPYLAWVSFAGLLNAAILFLN